MNVVCAPFEGELLLALVGTPDAISSSTGCGTTVTVAALAPREPISRGP